MKALISNKSITLICYHISKIALDSNTLSG